MPTSYIVAFHRRVPDPERFERVVRTKDRKAHITEHDRDHLRVLTILSPTKEAISGSLSRFLDRELR